MSRKGYLFCGVVAAVVLVVALVFGLSVAPVNTFASEDVNISLSAYQADNSSYLVEDYEEGVMIVGTTSTYPAASSILPSELNGKPVVAIGAGLYSFNPANARMCNVVIPASVRYIEANAFAGHTSLVIWFVGEVQSTFDAAWNSGNNAYVENVEVLTYTYQGDYFWETKTGSYINSFMDTDIHNKANHTTANYSFYGRTGLELVAFNGFAYDQNATSGYKGNLASLPEAQGARMYTLWTKSTGQGSQSCVAEGTLITLANGTQVPVESLTGNEELLVWDMMSGTYSSAPILFVDSDPAKVYEIVELSFADGTIVKVIDEHAFFDVDAQEYVFLRADAAKYIGHTFNKGDVNVELVAVNVYDEYTTAWSPVTSGALCLYVNGMLSMPGNTEGFINIFEVEDMKVDAEKMAQDIATYGLYTYEEFCAEVVEVPESVFEAFNGQYLKVSMAKGLISEDKVKALFDRYSSFFAEEQTVEVSVFEQIINAIKNAFNSLLKLFK